MRKLLPLTPTLSPSQVQGDGEREPKRIALHWKLDRMDVFPSSGAVASAFIAACRDELSALKPGNVHVHAAGHGMQARQFELSAEAAAPFIADPALKVGTRIRRAVEASLAVAGCNTNLGIVLLSAPLAAAAHKCVAGCGNDGAFTSSAWDSPPPNLPRKGGGTPSGKPMRGSPPANTVRPPSREAEIPSPLRDAIPPPLRGRLGGGEPQAPQLSAASKDSKGIARDLRSSLSLVLDTLDREDAAEAFRAIALARPAGLGDVAQEDVSRPPTVTLKEAMALAAGRDRVARAYVTDFEDVFALGLPILSEARALGAAPDLAVTTLHMNVLAAFEDSHISRKHGAAAAACVQRAAADLRPLWLPVATPDAVAALLAFDGQLKSRGLNPGTTADLVVATLFAEKLVRLLTKLPRPGA